MRFLVEGKKLVVLQGDERIVIEAWGTNSLRVRMTKEAEMDDNNWALTETVGKSDAKILISEIDVTEPWNKDDESLHKTASEAKIVNGEIEARVSFEGWISFYNSKGELLLSEYWRNRNRIDRYAVPLNVGARELKPVIGTDNYTLTARFEANENEHIYGMGQYQDEQLDKKGAHLELAQRNSQASVPFYISSLGYGFLWNNPAIGSVVFARNKTEWTAKCTKKLDYFITAGDTPSQISYQYHLATGFAPMMPEYGLGFWQCKLRYRTQEEILRVAREHVKERKLPMDAIVIDFFHWTKQGDFKFEERDFPDPEGMIIELKKLGVEPVVSIWPTVDDRSENFGEMAEKGYLVKADRGVSLTGTWCGNVVYFDATNPDARKFVWEKCKENYYSKGIKCFWLDEAEPEFGPYDFDLYRYRIGPALSCSNIYPYFYAKGFYDGLLKTGEKDIINLTRCAWAGSAKFGVLAWSGDVHSDFKALRIQLKAGLSMAVAGIPWWTSDIGGFVGGYSKDPDFIELFIRWFEWGAFCPVFRLHGERQPWTEGGYETVDGITKPTSGSDNEVWSYGEEVYDICRKYLNVREELRDYIRRTMKETHTDGLPVMRPLFYECFDDENCIGIEDEYFFGSRLLVAPVMEKGVYRREVYLPSGDDYTDFWTSEVYKGGQTIWVDAPIDVIPLFIRGDEVI
ncbi:MAG: family 31 glucosidase [Lachnospiraceae bacterium]|nr:family 31 glucosidase [Lachnospiraceae bacterium]